MPQDKEILQKLESIDKKMEQQNQKLDEVIAAIEAIESHTNILG